MSNELVGVVVGGVIGFFSSLLTNWYSRRNDSKDFVKGLRVEISDLHFHLIAGVVSVAFKVGTFDLQLAEFTDSELGKHNPSDPSVISIQDTIQPLLALKASPGIAGALAALNQQNSTNPAGAFVPVLTMPYLEANLNLMPTLPAATQRKLATVKRNISRYNDQVTEMRHYNQIDLNPEIATSWV